MIKNNPKDWRGTCEVCGAVFAYPDFECPKQPGKHTVSEKTYYHLGAGHIQNMKERRMFAPVLNLKADIEVRDKVTGQITKQDGVLIHFGPSGLFATANPEEQYYLDHKPGMLWGDEGRQQWEAMYLTSDQQLAKTQAQLDDVRRQVREGNILLETVKKNKTDAVAVR